MAIRFDDSLPTLVTFVAQTFDDNVFEQSVFIRDATGYLSVVLDFELPENRLVAVNKQARLALGNYARTDGCFRDFNGIGARRILADRLNARRVEIVGKKISFFDRRMVGADWLIPPASAAKLPRIAFSSL